MEEEEAKKEDQFGFTREGEALSYISLDLFRSPSTRSTWASIFLIGQGLMVLAFLIRSIVAIGLLQ